MATYQELFDLRSNSALKNKISVACTIAAEAIRTEDPATVNHAKRVLWAAQALANPDQEAVRMLTAVLAQNTVATSAQIAAASDATIQTAVNNAVSVFTS